MKDDEKKKHYLTSINIFLLIVSTIVIIFLIYVSILLISRPPIFSIFGETGGFLPTSIPVIIAASILVAIFLSFVLMVPNIPVGIKEELKRKKKSSKATKKQATTQSSATGPVATGPPVTPAVPTSSGFGIVTQPTQSQAVQQPMLITSKSSNL